jgi:hypothetical protein
MRQQMPRRFAMARRSCRGSEAKTCNLWDRIRELIPSIGGHETAIVVHNDAVVQGLSAVPYMRKTANRGILIEPRCAGRPPGG